MAFVDRIRFLGWANEESKEVTLLGFSPGSEATGEAAEDELATYLAETGRMIRRVEAPAHLARIVSLCYEIHPPLEDSQLKRVAGISVRRPHNPYSTKLVIDDRAKDPERPSDVSGVHILDV